MDAIKLGRIFIVGSLLSLMGLPYSAADRVFEVRSGVDKNVVTLGEECILSIDVRYSDDLQMLPFEKPKIPSLFIKEAVTIPTKSEDGVHIYGERWILTFFELGRQTLPAIPVKAKGKEGEPLQVTAPAIEVEVVSVGQRPGDTNDIRDILGPKPLGFQWNIKLIAKLLAALLLLLAFAGAVVWLCVRFILIYREKTKPLYRKALDAITRLEQSSLLQNQQEKEFFSEAIIILKKYLRLQKKVGHLELTTIEYLQAVRSEASLATVHEPIQELLRQTDMIKFAKSQPDSIQTKELIERVRQIITQTGDKKSSSWSTRF